jgi:alkylation response protein AidB-like acyl-CoA dehydrogenase
VDFDLTDDQLELQRIAREVAAKELPTSLVRRVVEDDADTSAVWDALRALEWPGLTVPPELDGSGAGLAELVVVLEEVGGALDPTPFLATVGQHLPLVDGSFGGDVRDERLRAVALGSPGAAVLEPHSVSARRAGDGWVLDGTAAHVLDGDRADELAVVAPLDDGSGVGVFLVPGASVDARRETAVDASLHLATVRFDGIVVPADRAVTGPDVAAVVDRTRAVALVTLSAVMVGASQRVFDLALDHIKQRHQFGVPIGSFQAVKHMACDAYLAISRARASVLLAARLLDNGDDQGLMAASLAKAAAGDAQRVATQHGIQLFGGLGYTWENDLHFFVRRAKIGDMLLGSAHEHRCRLSRLALEKVAAGEAPLDLPPDESTEAFRRELGEWIDANLPDPAETVERSTSSSHTPGWARRWQRKMFDAGWLVPGNPPEYGGRNASVLEQFVHQEELGRRRIYQTFNPQGLSIIVPSILAFGTEEQKQRWALPILRAEITASLGMSEPDAGSDLAGLRTRAVLDGDRFIVNGQKVWTSGAHDADVIFAFVRTDPDAPKHKGISCLVIPTDSPGLTRRPFGSIQGPDERDFNEVFFDDVEVPAENLIGQVNEGWRVATGSLGHERAMLWLGYAERLDDLITRGGKALLDRGLVDDTYTLDWFGQLVTDAFALRVLGHGVLAKVQKGMVPAEQSILKLMGSEASQRATLHVVEALGPDALDPTVRSAPLEPFNLDNWTNSWFGLYLGSFAATIAGGTSQIQRNIVAEHVLGLPR